MLCVVFIVIRNEGGSPRLKESSSGGSPRMTTSTSKVIGVSGLTAASSTDENALLTSSTISNSDNSNTVPLRQKRNWIPPLLGPLPDDFLRLTMPTTCSPYVAGLCKPQVSLFTIVYLTFSISIFYLFF